MLLRATVRRRHAPAVWLAVFTACSTTSTVLCSSWDLHITNLQVPEAFTANTACCIGRLLPHHCLLHTLQVPNLLVHDASSPPLLLTSRPPALSGTPTSCPTRSQRAYTFIPSLRLGPHQTLDLSTIALGPVLGVGGFGLIYAVYTDLGTGHGLQAFALKVCQSAKPQMDRRLHQEAVALLLCASCPFIVTLYAYQGPLSPGGAHYFVMEQAEGSLADLLDDRADLADDSPALSPTAILLPATPPVVPSPCRAVSATSAAQHTALGSCSELVPTAPAIPSTSTLPAFADEAMRPLMTHAEQQRVMASLLLAQVHLRACDIVHSDIKPQNVLVFTGTGTAAMTFKLCDFGGVTLAGHTCGSIIMTDLYAPSEAWGPGPGRPRRNPTDAWDLWASGVTCMELLFGRVHDSDSACMRTGGARVLLDGVPTATAEFLRGLLHPDLHQRLTLDQALDHTFFDGLDWNSLSPQLPSCQPSGRPACTRCIPPALQLPLLLQKVEPCPPCLTAQGVLPAVGVQDSASQIADLQCLCTSLTQSCEVDGAGRRHSEEQPWPMTCSDSQCVHSDASLRPDVSAGAARATGLNRSVVRPAHARAPRCTVQPLKWMAATLKRSWQTVKEVATATVNRLSRSS